MWATFDQIFLQIHLTLPINCITLYITYLIHVSFFVKIIEPDLSLSVTPSLSSGVQPSVEVTFTVQLRHSRKSTSHAYRMLLEVAVPRDYLSNAQITDSPAGGSITVVAGDQAPSRDPR